MNTTMIIILIVSSVLALGILGIFISRKFMLDYITFAKTLVAFIKIKLAENGIGVGNEKYTIILDIIIQSLCYIQSVSNSTSTLAYKLSIAYGFTKNLIQQAGITLSSNELELIRVILKHSFEFFLEIIVIIQKFF